ncbi:MAG: DUF3108 domain-containing protein [Kofleriaceae bacterium]
MTIGYWPLAAVLVTACAGAEAMSLQQPGAPAETGPTLGLHPGETMAFEVKLAGILAGEAQLAVGQIGDVGGRKAVVVKSRAATAGAAAMIKHIVDEATSVIDVATGRPMRLDSLVETGDRKIIASATFTRDAVHVLYQRSDDKAPRKLKLKPGNDVIHDAHTAMADLRGWRANVGAQRRVFIIGGRRVWRVDLTYGGITTIGSALGNRRAVRYDGRAFRAKHNLKVESTKPGRTFSVWLSDDADRVPLKMVATTELGEVVMDLTDYSR